MHRRAAGAAASVFLLFSLVGADRAGADPAQGGTASGHALAVDLAGEPLVEPTPMSEVQAPPFADDGNTAEDTSTVIEIPGDPLLLNATLHSEARVHQASDIASQLAQPDSQQAVPGPYNAQGLGLVEGLELLIDAVDEDVPLVRAEVLRGEAVAVCSGDTASYSANSEVVNLVIGGEDPLSGPLNDLVDEIAAGLEPLADLIDIEVNQVSPDGTTVDALVITVLNAAGPPPLAQIRLGHAEVSDVACGAGNTGGPPQCSDTEDNDGDGVIDAEDPGCHTDGDPDNPDSYDPDDDDEADGGGPECSDTEDNDGDGVIDAEDPGCHTDGDATNPDSFDPNDDTEADDTVQAGNTLPVTGSAVPMGIGLGLLVAAGAAEALRRRALA